MEATCARAVAYGLPSVAFTEHLEGARWVIPDDRRTDFGDLAGMIDRHGVLAPPVFDVGGYRAAVDRCRERFADLRVFTGVEVGEPHRHAPQVDAVLDGGGFERILGSLHSIVIDGEERIVDEVFGDATRSDEDVEVLMHRYLDDLRSMVVEDDRFEVLAHVDYPVRRLVERSQRFDLTTYRTQYMEVLEALAATSRVLEYNTTIPMSGVIMEWWYDVGGTAVSVGSDAHEPGRVGRGFSRAESILTSIGFRSLGDPNGFMVR